MSAPYIGALANREFVKMNGLGNEIVVVDLRRSPKPIEPAPLAPRRGRSPMTN